MARELARQIPEGQDPAVRVRILRELAIAEAEALLWEEVQDAVQEALAALCERTDAPDACAGFLSMVVRALKDGALPCTSGSRCLSAAWSWSRSDGTCSGPG